MIYVCPEKDCAVTKVCEGCKCGMIIPPDYPVYRHVARGTHYEVLGYAQLQSAKPIEEGVMLVVYRGEDGGLWARPRAEFIDGRFQPTPRGEFHARLEPDGSDTGTT